MLIDNQTWYHVPQVFASTIWVLNLFDLDPQASHQIQIDYRWVEGCIKVWDSHSVLAVKNEFKYNWSSTFCQLEIKYRWLTWVPTLLKFSLHLFFLILSSMPTILRCLLASSWGDSTTSLYWEVQEWSVLSFSLLENVLCWHTSWMLFFDCG